MGGALSGMFHSSTLLSPGNHRNVSDQTRDVIEEIFCVLRAKPRVTTQLLEGLLVKIPKGENILLVHDKEGYNLLHKCVGLNNVDMVRWILSRNVDLNRGACSFPLHMACLYGHLQIVEMLLKHGARIDVEARMCWPGLHHHNCEERGKYSNEREDTRTERTGDKLQNAICYAIDGDQVNILERLTQNGEDHWFPWQTKRPLLHVACNRGAWKCCNYLVETRHEEINQCFDEYYPIHQAVLHHTKFVELLISRNLIFMLGGKLCPLKGHTVRIFVLRYGAQTTVHTATQQMTPLHILYLIGRKSAKATLQTTKLLLDNGMKDAINDPDSLGNTPLHGLIVRYAIEEARFGYHDNQPWNKWDVLHLVRYLLQNGARPSINQPGNSALACVLRHVRCWEFRYELLSMLLQEGGNPHVVGRDGSAPLMVCLVPLINKDPLHQFTHNMKVCYINCVRILCKHGASPNCSSRSNLTPLHVLVFTANESIALSCQEEKSKNFEFIRNLLVLLLQNGLNHNVSFSQRTPHIFPALLDMVPNVRTPSDLKHVYSLLLALLQFGANPNVNIANPQEPARPQSASLFAKNTSNNVLCYYIEVICRKEEIYMDAAQSFVRIIMLFYLTMDHKPLYACLRVLFTQSTGLIPVRASALTNVIRDLHSSPRSLKQICRICIYTSLRRKPGVYANKLPLPPTLREYILNFEP